MTPFPGHGSTADDNASMPGRNAHGRSQQTLLRIALAGLAFILLWEALGADLRVMAWFADGHGFTLRHDWWLRILLHDGLRYASAAAYVAVGVALWKPFGFLRAWTPRQRLESFVGVTASLLAVSAMKSASLTSCPWDLGQFGGTAQFVSHWAWGLGDSGPGRCFPSGHASAGYGFFALAVPGLAAGTAAARRHGWRLFWIVFFAGLLCGMTQVLRGAHYPSHVLWTGFICWSVAMLNHHLFRHATPSSAFS